MVFAQKTIQIGTIGIAQVAQPALAVVWSFLLLGEVINHRQMVGIAIVVGGCSPSSQRHHTSAGVAQRRAPGEAQIGAAADRRRASTRSRSVMKCEAASMRRSAVVAAAPARWRRRPASAAMRASASSANTSTGASPSRRASSRIAAEALLRARDPSAASSAASRQSPSAACSPPPAARCHAAADSSAARARGVAAERAQDAPEMDPGERGQAHVAGRLGLLDRQLQRGGARRRSRRPGTAPGRGSTTW